MIKSIALVLLVVLSFTQLTYAQKTLIGLATDGSIYQVDLATGVVTLKGGEEISDFSLGGATRKRSTFYYVATPSGSSEKALYTFNINTAVLSHVDLDRNDSVRALFLQGRRLYAVFYNGDAGTGGVYRIDPTTGVTTLIVDLDSLAIEPIGGAFAKLGRFFYLIGQPESDSTQRRLIRFKLKAGSALAKEITTTDSIPVVCDRLKVNERMQNFVCLATVSETQVDVCRLRANGIATCLNTLSDVKRLAGGHTMVTPNERIYYSFTYSPTDDNDQHLVKFNARGQVKSSVLIDPIIVGAAFN